MPSTRMNVYLVPRITCPLRCRRRSERQQTPQCRPLALLPPGEAKLIRPLCERRMRSRLIPPPTSVGTVLYVAISRYRRVVIWAVFLSLVVWAALGPGRVTSPRFDTPIQAAANVIGIALWVGTARLMRRRSRRGIRMSGWDQVALFAGFSIGGVYVPILPICWLVGRWREVEHRVPGEADNSFPSQRVSST